MTVLGRDALQIFRHFRLVYSSPEQRNVSRRVQVGVGLVATRLTKEFGLALAVALFAVAALSACTAGVARVHEYDWEPRKLRLVLDKVPELREGPTTMPCSLFASNRCLFTDTLQIFKGDPASSAFRILNERFGDGMIGVTPEPLLPLADTLHGAAGVPTGTAFVFSSHLPTKRAPGPKMTLPDGLDFGTGVYVPVRIRGEMGDAEIHPEKVGDFDRCAFRHIDGGEQVELAVSVDQIHLTPEPIKPLTLVLAENVGHNLAAFECPNRDTRKPFPRQDPFVVSDRSIGLEYWTLFLVAPEDFDGLGNGPDGHLSGEFVFPADLKVAPAMDGRLAKYARLETNSRSMARGGVERFHRGKQKVPVFTGKDLELDGQFHDTKYRSKTFFTQWEGRSSAVKDGGLSARR